MPFAPQYPSGWNTYVPGTQSTNNLIINFARNPKDFKTLNYTQVIKVDKNVGMYTRMTNEVCARFLHSNDSVWQDGNERPMGFHNLESFARETYRTVRRTFPVTLGYNITEQADWNMFSQYERMLATQAMTARSQMIVDCMMTEASYDASHIFNVTSSYGDWGASLTADGFIKNTLYTAINTIVKDTLGVVQQKDLVLIVGPEAAKKIALSQEIVDYIKGSPESWKATQGQLGTSPYGLPETLYGVRVIVEDGVKVTNKKGNATVREWIFPENMGILCSRVGGLEGFEGPNFSTCVLFAKEEMTTERFDDAENRRTKLSVTEDYAPMVIAPVSGIIFKNLFAA